MVDSRWKKTHQTRATINLKRHTEKLSSKAEAQKRMGDPWLNKTAGWVTRANKKPEGKMAPEKNSQKAAKQQPAKTGDLTKSERELSAYQNDRAFGHTTPASGKFFFMFEANEQPPVG